MRLVTTTNKKKLRIWAFDSKELVYSTEYDNFYKVRKSSLTLDNRGGRCFVVYFYENKLYKGCTRVYLLNLQDQFKVESIALG